MRTMNTRIITTAGMVALAAAGFCSAARAQFKNGAQPTELTIPRVSQAASVNQRVGLTDITINYSSPAVGGREIFGKVVPYGKMWRAGANENTTINLTDDVTIEGKPLAAGRYGLHAIPDKEQWTMVFSKNSTSWGSFSYDEKEDALRVTVKPHPAEFREVLAYTFDDTKADSTNATLRWDKLAVPIHIAVDVKAVVLKSIKNELRNVGGFTWAGYDEAAQWCLDNNYELEQALKWENTSLQNEARFENWETKSRILAAMGNKEESAKALNVALENANAQQLYVYARGIQRQGDQKRAFEVYSMGVKKYPDHWLSQLAAARIASGSGDFPGAASHMKAAIAAAPDNNRPFLEPMLKRLENKDDINK